MLKIRQRQTDLYSELLCWKTGCRHRNALPKQGTRCPFLSGWYHLVMCSLMFHVSTKSWHLSRKAYSSAVSFNLSKRPDCEKWPAPKSHLKSRMRLSVLFSLNLATNFAGSLHITNNTAQDLRARLCLSLPKSLNRRWMEKSHASTNRPTNCAHARSYQYPTRGSWRPAVTKILG